MRILQVVSTPPFAWGSGGCARSVYEVSRALVRKGHEVTILTTDLLEPGRRYVGATNPENIDGLSIHRSKNLSDWLAWRHKIYIAPDFVIQLRKHIPEFDIVHLQDLLSTQAVWTAMVCAKIKKKYVLTSHGSAIRLMEDDAFGHLYYRLRGSRIVSNASRITALTRNELSQFVALGYPETQIDIIPNGIRLEDFDAMPRRGCFRENHGIDQDTKIILYIGRIHRIKGLDMLMEAFSEILNDTDQVVLAIVGPDDGYAQEMKKSALNLGIKGKVIFTGPLYGSAKLEAFVDSDVNVLPSRYETFPMTVLEAWSCGTPVVATDRCGISEYVREAGMVVPFNKSDLTMAITELLTNDSLRSACIKKGRTLIREEFNIDKIILKLEQVYLRALREEHDE